MIIDCREWRSQQANVRGNQRSVSLIKLDLALQAVEENERTKPKNQPQSNTHRKSGISFAHFGLITSGCGYTGVEGASTIHHFEVPCFRSVDVGVSFGSEYHHTAASV